MHLIDEDWALFYIGLTFGWIWLAHAFFTRCFFIHYRWRVIRSNFTSVQLLLFLSHQPWFMDKFCWDWCQLRYPFSDKIPFRILVLWLLANRICAYGINACHAWLHVHLRPMNTGFIVKEKTCQVHSSVLPRQPQRVGCNRLKHRPHSEIYPACCRKWAHACIKKWPTSLPIRPCLVSLFIVTSFEMPIKFRIDCNLIHCRFKFKSLNKMTMPSKSALEWTQTGCPTSVFCRTRVDSHLLLFSSAVMQDLANRDAACADVRW